MTTAATAAGHSRLSTRAALASVTLALVLLVAKGWAAYATDSTAMLGSLADTGLDVMLMTLRKAVGSEPADDIALLVAEYRPEAESH